MPEIAPGEGDEALLKRAVNENWILIIEDKDFGELTVRRPYAVAIPGIILLRLPAVRDIPKAERFLAVLAAAGDRLAGKYVVIQADKIRIRPLLFLATSQDPLDRGSGNSEP
jgi:predicted nuclease of predicted toxin-antitoxin system